MTKNAFFTKISQFKTKFIRKNQEFTTIMENENRLNDLYNLACIFKLVSNKGEFASLIGVSNASLSHALKDDGKVSLPNAIRKAENSLISAGIPVSVVMGDKSKIDTSIHIDASGDHIEAGGDVNNRTSIASSTINEELIALRVENKMLKEQIEELRKDKELLTKLLSR